MALTDAPGTGSISPHYEIRLQAQNSICATDEAKIVRAELVPAHDMTTGNFWLLVFMVATFAPCVVAKLKNTS